MTLTASISLNINGRCVYGIKAGYYSFIPCTGFGFALRSFCKVANNIGYVIVSPNSLSEILKEMFSKLCVYLALYGCLEADQGLDW